jgi:hypothetical protein
MLFLYGFLLASLFYFYMEDNYEHEVFKVLTNNVKASNSAPDNKDSIILHSLHLTHFLGEGRSKIFGHDRINSLKSFIHPVTFDLQTTQGACGSYAYILGRLLKEFNIESRIAQMSVNGVYGGHMVVEAYSSRGWVVVDPTFNLFFTKEDGNLASFKDVQGNWESYKQQVPADYDMSYAYAGARYTNWQKIPVVMPALKQLLYWTMGKEKTDGFSMRMLFLEKYQVLFNVTLVLYLILILVTFRKYGKGLFRRRIARYKMMPGQPSVSGYTV